MERRRIVAAAEEHDGELDAEERLESSDVRHVLIDVDLDAERRIEPAAADGGSSSRTRRGSIARTTPVTSRSRPIESSVHAPSSALDEVAGAALVEVSGGRRRAGRNRTRPERRS